MSKELENPLDAIKAIAISPEVRAFSDALDALMNKHLDAVPVPVMVAVMAFSIGELTAFLEEQGGKRRKLDLMVDANRAAGEKAHRLARRAQLGGLQ